LAETLGDPVLLARARFEAGAATYMRGGDLEPAGALLGEAEAAFAAAGTAPLDHVMTLTSLAFVALFGGDSTRAAEICSRCREICRRRGDQWWLAYTLLASAEVAYRAGDITQGEQYAKEALRLHHMVGAISAVAVALDDVAYAAAQRGDAERAACLLGADLRISDAVGQDVDERRRYWQSMAGMLEKVRSALGDARFTAAFERGRRMEPDDAVAYALGADPVPARTTTTPAADTLLTRREREVAELVAQGLSNREIATRLVISQRTAESHVENILRKLGFGSRTQIAVWATRQVSEAGTPGHAG
jgi:DNA-binding CsgD family transcriptional regulator